MTLKLDQTISYTFRSSALWSDKKHLSFLRNELVLLSHFVNEVALFSDWSLVVKHRLHLQCDCSDTTLSRNGYRKEHFITFKLIAWTLHTYTVPPMSAKVDLGVSRAVIINKYKYYRTSVSL